MKTIITLDKANQSYGFPQLNANANLENVVVEGMTGTSVVISGATPLRLLNVPFLSGGTLLSIDNDGYVHYTTGGTGGSNLKYYAEPSVAPLLPPSVSGLSSIAIGDGAQASSDYMFVVGFGAGTGTTISTSKSNFIGFQAGVNANYSSNSNFIGDNAGFGANDSPNSNFIGFRAGLNAFESPYSNFIGTQAGNNAYNTSASNFIGNIAGFGANDSPYSNFIGSGAGVGANKSSFSNFIGSNAGNNTFEVSNSNFIGSGAGQNSSGSSLSTLIGYRVGFASDYSSSIGSNNIIIGTNISLGPNATDSVNIGGVIFARNTHSNSGTTPSISAQNNGMVGINVIPSAITNTLHVSASTNPLRIEGLQNSGNTRYLVTDTNGVVSYRTDVANTNIYNSDGALTSNRTVDLSGRTLTFSGGNIGIASTVPFSGAVVSDSMEIGTFNGVYADGNLTVRGYSSLGGISKGSWGAVGSNYYLDIFNILRRRYADSVSILDFENGGFIFKNSSSSTANSAISLTPLLTIRNNGNVLINTTTDSGFRLDVSGTARTSLLHTFLQGTFIDANTSNNYYSVDTGGSTYGGLALRNLIQDYTGYIQTGRAGNSNGINFLHTTYNGAPSGTYQQKFMTNSVEFGTRNIQNTLTVYKSGSGTQSALILSNLINTTNTGIGILFRTRDGADAIDIDHAAINAFKTNLGGGLVTSRLTFSTINNTANTLTEIMRISDGGNVLIGTTTDSGFKLDVNGTSRITDTLTMGIGTSSTTINNTILSVDGTTNLNYLNINNHLNVNAAATRTSRLGDSNRLIVGLSNSSGWTSGFLFGIDGQQQDAGLLYRRDGQAVSIVNGFNFNSSTYTDRLTVQRNGNIGINTTVDAGFRLDVNGNVRFTTDAANNDITFTPANQYTRFTFNAQGVSGMTYANPQNSVMDGIAQPYSIGLVTNITGLNVVIGNVNASNAGGGVNYYSQRNGDRHSHRWFHNGNQQMRLSFGGNLLIGTDVDSANRLEVAGTARISGTSTTGATLDVVGTGRVSATTTGTAFTIISSGNTTLPVFSVVGSSGELFSVTDSLTGSLFSVNDISGLPILEVFSDNRIVMGSYVTPATVTTTRATITGLGQTIYSFPTSGGTGAFYDYTVSGSTGVRAGNLFAVWSGSTVEFTEVSTNDIGVTTNLTFDFTISSGNVLLRGNSSSGTWIVKIIFRGV